MWVHKPDTSLCHGSVRRIYNLLWNLVLFFICLGVVDGLCWVVHFVELLFCLFSAPADIYRPVYCESWGAWPEHYYCWYPLQFGHAVVHPQGHTYSHVLIRCLSLIRYASKFLPCSCVQELNIYHWYMIFCLGS